jgi:hypothetical protein
VRRQVECATLNDSYIQVIIYSFLAAVGFELGLTLARQVLYHLSHSTGLRHLFLLCQKDKSFPQSGMHPPTKSVISCWLVCHGADTQRNVF